jgi:hypothetical protein
MFTLAVGQLFSGEFEKSPPSVSDLLQLIFDPEVGVFPVFPKGSRTTVSSSLVLNNWEIAS